jgi:hypothetical protein
MGCTSTAYFEDDLCACSLLSFRRTIFYYLLNFAITNAFILFREYRKKKNLKALTVTDFRLMLITEFCRHAEKLEILEKAAPAPPAPVVPNEPAVPVMGGAGAAAGGDPAPQVAADDVEDMINFSADEDDEEEESSDLDDSDCVTATSSDESDEDEEGFLVPEDPPRHPDAGTRKTAPKYTTVKGSHRVEVVHGQHRCVVCGKPHAFVVCTTCDPPVYLCLTSTRNCYNVYHKHA